MTTTRFRLATVARCAVAFALAAVAAVWSLPLRAGSISPSDIRVEIATNLVWLDNITNPVVGVLDGQQNFFDRLVTEASPLLRITNLSTDKRFIGGQLGLQNSAAQIVNIEFIQAPGKTNWFWSGPDASVAINHAHFQFINPLMPGQTASMRFTTAERVAGYTMEQNLFSNLPQYGILSVGVDKSLSTDPVQFDPVTGAPIGLPIVPGFSFDLSTVPERRYGSNAGVYAVEIVPIPEPTGFVLAGAAAASLAIWRGWGRRRVAKLGKV